MLYVTLHSYEGPNVNERRYADSTEIRIQTSPLIGNSSHEAVINGWAGTTNDWSEEGMGEYETLDEAVAMIDAHWGEVREIEDRRSSRPDYVVAVFKPGRYEPLSKDAVEDMFYKELEEKVSAETTDDEIEDFARDCEDLANDNGWTCDRWVVSVAKYIRREAIARA